MRELRLRADPACPVCGGDLFIHGFGSCGWGAKSLLLRRHLGIDHLLAPDLPFDPRRTVAHLRELLKHYPVTALIGSSLGGFYATCLSDGARPLPAVLINPVVRAAPACRAPRHPGGDGGGARFCVEQFLDGPEATLSALLGEKRNLVLRQG